MKFKNPKVKKKEAGNSTQTNIRGKKNRNYKWETKQTRNQEDMRCGADSAEPQSDSELPNIEGRGGT